MRSSRRAGLFVLTSLSLLGCGALIGIGDLDVKPGGPGSDGGLDGALADGTTPTDGPITGDGGGGDTGSGGDGSVTTPGGICSDDGWCWSNPLPFGTDLQGIWGATSGEIFVVGAAGSVFQIVNGKLSRIPTPTGQWLHAAWGTAANNVWVVGDDAVAMQWTGAKWNFVSSAGGADIYSVDGRAANDVWAAGAFGAVHHYDGTAWNDMGNLAGYVYGVAVAGPDDVYFGGASGLFSHWGVVADGGKDFTQGTVSVPGDVNGLTAISPDELWLVGDNGANVHVTPSDGGLVVGTPLSQTVERVRGRSATDIWTVGGIGAHWDGTTWSEQQIGNNSYYRDVFPAAGGDVWAVGDYGSLVHNAGGTWSDLRKGDLSDLFGVWGSGANDVWAVGDAGACLHWDGAAWKPSTPVVNGPLYGVWVSPAGEMWAGGVGGAIVHAAAGSTTVSKAVSPSTKDIHGMWGSAANDVWAVGDGGEITHYDGTTWKSVTSPVTTSLISVQGLSASDAWIGGAGGIALHLEANQWVKKDIGTAADVNAIFTGAAGDVWASGASGPPNNRVEATVRLSGGTWGGTAGPLDVVYGGAFEVLGMWGTAATDLWAVGVGGNIGHFDGTAWTKSQSGMRRYLARAWGASAKDVWVVGDTGAILHLVR